MIPFLEPIARVIAWVPWLCLAYTNAVVQSLAAWPLAAVDIGHISSMWLVPYYVLLFTAVIAARRRVRSIQRPKTRTAGMRSLAVTIGLPVAVVTLLGLAALQLPDG